jgi:hypothetical protein
LIIKGKPKRRFASSKKRRFFVASFLLLVNLRIKPVNVNTYLGRIRSKEAFVSKVTAMDKVYRGLFSAIVTTACVYFLVFPAGLCRTVGLAKCGELGAINGAQPDNMPVSALSADAPLRFRLRERNPNNNLLSRGFQPSADLRIEGLSAYAARVESNRPRQITLSFRVVNAGQGFIGKAFRVSVFPGNITQNGKLQASYININQLAAEETAYASHTIENRISARVENELEDAVPMPQQAENRSFLTNIPRRAESAEHAAPGVSFERRGDGLNARACSFRSVFLSQSCGGHLFHCLNGRKLRRPVRGSARRRVDNAWRR